MNPRSRVTNSVNLMKVSGIDPIATNPGVGEFDTLTGGEGKDRFLLGDSDKIYYSGDGNAVISDFNSADDAIVLSGVKANHSLAVSGNVASIFLKKPGQSDDLIATVQGVTDLNLDRPYFTFIKTIRDVGNSDTLVLRGKRHGGLQSPCSFFS